MKKLYLIFATIFVLTINVHAKTDAPSAWYNTDVIVETFPYEIEGKKYTMQYATLKSNMKEIITVYFIPDGYDKYAEDNLTPPSFKKLIYHKLTTVEESFVGVWTCEEAICAGIPTLIYREIRLPDEIANKLIDLLSGDYKLPPHKYLKDNCVEEVHDSKLLKSKYEEMYNF